MTETALVKTGAEIDAQLERNEGGFVMKTMDDVSRFAKWVVTYKMAPKCYTEPGQVVVAIQTGAEAGLTPMASVRSIYVVNGMPSWTSESARSLVRRGYQNVFTGTVTPVLYQGTDIEEGTWHSHPPSKDKKTCTDDCYGWCKTYPRSRAGESVKTEFSVGDAKLGGLWDKPGPWQNYHSRMLMHRATSFHLRDNYGGVLLGLTTQEETEDWPKAAFARVHGSQIEAGATPTKGDPLFGPQKPIVEPETVDIAPEQPDLLAEYDLEQQEDQDASRYDADGKRLPDDEVEPPF